MFRSVAFAGIVCLSLGCSQPDEAPLIEDDDAGSDSGGLPEIDRSDEFFSQDIINIDINLPEDRWDELRTTFRSRVDLLGGENCSDTPYGKAFDWVQANIEIDGSLYENVGIRKKGFGSQSTLKPSLKIDLGRYGFKQEHLSLDRFIINNNKSDDTEIRQCFSYWMMEKAGLPTPRCTFATATVNGEDLGVFTVVEEVKESFLETHFGSSSGNLYEGESNDFRSAFMGFDQDNNEEVDSSRADLERAREILGAANADNALEEVAKVVDLDSFYTHWAGEVLIWHRDGYAGNLNNFFFYADPNDDGRFKFIPWGTDNTMRNETRTTIPHSTLAFSLIPNLLYSNPEGRRRFYETLDSMLDEHWDEEVLNQWIDEKTSFLEPFIREQDVAFFQSEVDTIKETVNVRKQVIGDARLYGEPLWEAGLRGEICRVEAGTIEGEVTLNANGLGVVDYTAGLASYSFTIDGSENAPQISSGAFGGQHELGFDRVVTIAEYEDDRRFFISFIMPNPRFFEPFTTGGAQRFISTAFSGTVIERDLTINSNTDRYDIDHGTITGTEIDFSIGGQVSFTFEAKLYRR